MFLKLCEKLLENNLFLGLDNRLWQRPNFRASCYWIWAPGVFADHMSCAGLSYNSLGFVLTIILRKQLMSVIFNNEKTPGDRSMPIHVNNALFPVNASISKLIALSCFGFELLRRWFLDGMWYSDNVSCSSLMGKTRGYSVLTCLKYYRGCGWLIPTFNPIQPNTQNHRLSVTYSICFSICRSFLHVFLHARDRILNRQPLPSWNLCLSWFCF